MISSLCVGSGNDIKPGDQAPPISLFMLENNKYFRSKDLLGKKNLVVSFFATWWQPCMKELPILEKVYQKYKDKRVKFFLIDITEATRNNPGTVYGMSYKDVPKAGPFLKEKGVTMQILYDNRGTAMKRYNAETLPRLFMADGFRKITFMKRGFPDEEGAEEKFNKDISAEIDRLLSELPPSKK